MDVLIATTQGSADRLRRRILGVPVGLRSVLTAIDAGARSIEVSGPSADVVIGLAKDARVGVTVRAYVPSRRERVVVEAGALIAPELLRVLAHGEALVSDSDQLLAARRNFQPGDKPSTPLAGLPVLAFPHEPHLYSLFVQSEADVARAQRILLRAQSRPGDSWLTTQVFRRLSSWLTRAGAALRIPAAAYSLFALGLAVAGAWLLSRGVATETTLGSALLLASCIFGCADGELARITHRLSVTNATFDAIAAETTRALACLSAVAASMHASAAWALALTGGGTLLWFAALLIRDFRGRVGTPTAWPWAKELVHRDVVVVLCVMLVSLGASAFASVLWVAVALIELGRAVLPMPVSKTSLAR